MKLVRQLSRSSQVTSSITTRSKRLKNKTYRTPVETRKTNVDVATNKNKFENSTRNRNKDIKPGMEALNWNDSELNKEVNKKSESSTKNTSPESKIVVPADAFNNFEEVLIKKEIQDQDTNNDKSGDDNNVNQKVVGGIPDVSNGLMSVQGSSTAGNITKVSPQGKRVFIIKSVSGKSVTLIPRTPPVVLAKENSENKLVNSAVKVDNSCQIVGKTSLNIVNNVTSRVAVASNKLKPKTYVNVTKSIGNNSQCISTQTNIQLLKLSNLAVPNTMPKIVNKLKDKTAIANLNGKKRFSVEDINEMPMYVDNHTQTDEKLLKDCIVQTDVYVPSPARSIEELPHITELVEYLLETPKYSDGLDEIKKSDLLGMSKSIIMKGNTSSEITATNAITKSNMSENLKTQLFLDLKNCLTLDFLGNMPIHNAIIENSSSLLKRQCFALKLRQMSINIENNQCLTPLQLAIVNGCDSQILTILLENGADVNIKDSEGSTTVHLAVLNSTDYNLSMILQHPNPLKNKLINCKNDDGLTPLMLAAIESKADMVDILLKNGADPNLRDEKSGRTALFHAVEVNSNFVINLLLKYRADPRIRNFFGLTVLDAAKDLDMQDVNLLENNEINPTVSINVNKRPHTIQKTGNNAKKSKLSFIPSYQRVELSTIQKSVRKKIVVMPSLKQ